MWFRIDHNLVIKVADFGLSEDVYSRNYFRLVEGEEGSTIKLPVRWMALESLLDRVFSEKTDVVWVENCSQVYCTHYISELAVVLWSNLLGGVYSWPHPLPYYWLTVFGYIFKRRKAAREAQQCSLFYFHVKPL